MHNVLQPVAGQWFHENMDEVGHDHMLVEDVALAGEVAQRSAYDFRVLRIA